MNYNNIFEYDIEINKVSASFSLNFNWIKLKTLAEPCANNY